jgi:curved DNA-binding protein CbpA
MPGEREQPTVRPAVDADDDLPSALRDEIVALDLRLDRITHYEALGLPWGAGAEQARDAYLDRARRFHPDRYGGRKLGAQRARLDRIMRRLTEARDVLCDDARRAAYEDRTATPDEFARRAARRIEDELRAEERRARLGRTNPLVARAARVTALLKRGRELVAEGKHAQAANDFLTAAALDPRHAEARRLAEEARRALEAERAHELYEEGLRHEAAGRDEHALERFRGASDRAPRDPRPAIAAARVALRLGRGEESREWAVLATRAAPRDARAFAALGEAHAALGDRGEAKKALERALELDGGLEQAKGLRKKLRWSPFR